MPPGGEISGGASTERPGMLVIHSLSSCTPCWSMVSRASGGILMSPDVFTRM